MPDITILVPSEDVTVILDTVEQVIEDIVEADCDCDDCARQLMVMNELSEAILRVAPLSLKIKKGKSK